MYHLATEAAPPSPIASVHWACHRCQQLELTHSNGRRRYCGGGGRKQCVCVCVCVRAECDVFPIDTLSKCAPPLSPLPTATATTGPRGRNKQSSDNGTSSCSPIRNRCGRRALERKKKRKTTPNGPSLSGSLIQEYFQAPPGSLFYSGQSCVLAFLSSYSQRTVPCSRSRMFWRHQQSLLIHQRQGFFHPDQYWRRWCKLLEYILTEHRASAIHWCYLQSNQASKHLEQMAVAPSLLQFNCPDHPAQSVIEMWL